MSLFIIYNLIFYVGNIINVVNSGEFYIPNLGLSMLHEVKSFILNAYLNNFVQSFIALSNHILLICT